MGICAEELRHYVVQPTLKQLQIKHCLAENLLMGTAAQESGLGFYLRPKKHHSYGIYCITPIMHRNIWDKYLVQLPELASQVRGLASQHEFLENPHQELATNLSYATAIAWMVYQRVPNFPTKGDPSNLGLLGKCWRRYYHGKPQASLDDFIHNYHQYILGTPQAA
ncbi:hypothetical protein [Spartinivicinus poritis]|uniref:Uncharacterized protein n=1 Tax=Spartinivicinus poritis TaxID=2994640 RepID=A0ABT5UC32_9GAMM|nr:hypothetical protein [Spartinivicinus sp. A2-2]MDE1463943.1 hypothetical protein [Spartinivicinus sp. A2-2]